MLLGLYKKNWKMYNIVIFFKGNQEGAGYVCVFVCLFDCLLFKAVKKKG